jgi:putative FmdB family regulatory protein
MPTYEYRCPKGHVFDVFQKMSDEPVATCPECGESAERQISAGAGFLFKGEGFYITDYRSKEYREKAKGEKAKGEKGGGAGKEGGGSAPKDAGSSGGGTAGGDGGAKPSSSGSGDA